MLRMIVAAILLALALAPAEAQEQTSKDYAACVDKAAGAAIPMQDCIANEQVRQTRRLQAALSALMTSMPAKRSQLRNAQRKWGDFRDAHCSFFDSGKVVQAVRLAANECVLNFTVQRAAELEKLKAP